jgi:hypothetical protein
MNELEQVMEKLSQQFDDINAKIAAITEALKEAQE